MHRLQDIRDRLMDELVECSKEELSKSSLDTIDKLTHSIKSIDTILAMAGYSKDNSYKRDSMGRYSRKNDDMKRKLEEMKNDADDETRHMIDDWLKQVH